ncbi:MAG: ferric reductase-like transmembrane domain-containing protein [Chloroflexales bacterium]|nr:ferric reductase-like transmembrane domain-containing protein [Chloroflexales bacterium]
MQKEHAAPTRPIRQARLRRIWQDVNAIPLTVLAIYLLAIYIILISLYNLFLGVQFRLATMTLAFPGDTSDPLYELGTSLGFWSMIYFCLNFLLATRWRWIERLCGGLDQVYQLHAFVGKMTLTMVVLHMAILVIQATPDLQLIATYVVPGIDLSYTFGLLGMLILTTLVILTIWIKLAYHIWLETHKAMGLAYVLGGMHAIILQVDWYMIVLTALGGYAWFYNLFLYRRFGPRYAGTLTHNALKADVNELQISLDRPMPVQPGQFVFIAVQQSAHPIALEQHPFSVSQIIAPHSIRVSAKTLGDYTAKLRHLAVHDQLIVFGPYGAFGEKYRTTCGDMVWIAGGIGITPFLSMLQAEGTAAPTVQRALHVIWTVSAAADAVYHDEICAVQQAAPHISYQLHVSSASGRLSYDALVRLLGQPALAQSTIFICGPLPMMHTLRQQFLRHGKQRRAIITEEFALR